MKTKITTIIAMLAFAITLSAQKGNVSSADYELTLDEPNLEKAEEKILAAEAHEKTMNYAKTYLVKERVYSAMYAKDKSKYEYLFTAHDAIVKAEELDIKGDEKGKGKLKFKDDIKKDLVLLRIEMRNCGAEFYNVKENDMALLCFEKTLEIDLMSTLQEEGQPASLDTALLFNAAICAYYGKDLEKTEKYMLECIDYGYGESTPHTVMYIQYREAGDTVKMVEMLEDGFKHYPDDATFLKELVVYYINAQDFEQGMAYINLALESDPSNSSFWFTKGTFHDQSGEQDIAVESYNKALETAVTDDEIYNANYNLAVIYYNVAVEASNAANDEMDMKKSQALGDVAKKKFRDCVPYFEICLSYKPDDLETLQALRPVYYRLSDDAEVMKKYEELQKNIKRLEEGLE